MTLQTRTDTRAQACLDLASVFQHPLLEEAATPATARERHEQRMLVHQAEQACLDCPLMQHCLYRAVVEHEVAGFVAGTTQRQRQEIRARLGVRVNPEDLDAFTGAGRSHHQVDTGEMRLQSVDELCAEPVTRVIIRDPEASTEDFNKLAKGLGMRGVSYFIGWSAWLDIAPVGVNKATGLKAVCAELGVKRKDVLALGDGRNDVHMLRWAGRGVAIGDAPDEVQRCADHVTGTFADGGTVQELARWL